MTFNGHEPSSYPPGETLEEQLRHTWQAVVAETNRVIELHAMALKIDGRVGRIMAKLGVVDDGLPPMRAEAPSSATLEQMEPRLVDAAERGEREPGTDAATEVRRIMQEEKEKAEARENARRIAQLDAEAAQRKRDRRKFWLTTASAVTGGLGLAGAIELVKWLSSLHH